MGQQIVPGNIDLATRPRVKNADGSISTVRSISVNVDGKEVLIPTVVGDRVVSNDEAIREYKRTGKHLGIFADVASANQAAQSIHESEAAKLMADPQKVYLDDQGNQITGTSTYLDEQGNAVTPPKADKPDNGIGTFLSHAASSFNPLPALVEMGNALLSAGKGTVELNTGHPLKAAQDFKDAGKPYQHLVDAHEAVRKRMVDSFDKGNYVEAARHLLGYVVPGIGPALDEAGNETGRGEYAAGIGDAVGLGSALVAPEVIAKGLAKIKIPALARNPNAAEAEAVRFGQSRGIPVDAGTATGNRYVKGVQVAADNTPIGGAVATRAKQTQAANLTRVGEELAGDVLPNAMTPEQAGSGVSDQLTAKIQSHSQAANQAYDALRTLEADPKFAKHVQVGTETVDTGLPAKDGGTLKQTKPIIEKIQMPVDLRTAKASLKTIYDQLTRQYSVTQQQASAGYKALGNIVHGPDFAPLTQVETDLGAIKSIARGADMPELRTKSQGLAASGVSQLDAAVTRTAAQAGPEVYRALKQGRAATAEKFATADILDRIRTEPVQAYRQMTAPKDSGIDLLRMVQKQTPHALPQIARAYLDDALGTATAEGGFDKSARLAADWNKLGPETKKLLFTPPQQAALDKYFLLAKKLGESPNPSGTALVSTAAGSTALIITNPATGIPLTLGAGAISKMLRSPAAVKALTEGLTLSLGPGRLSKTAQGIAVTKFVNAAREAGVSLEAIPAGAGGPTEQSRPSETAQQAR